MQVFISWSGALSKQVAEHLKSWLGDVLQGVKIWISHEDIDKGSLWFGDILHNLSATDIGIVCITHDNREAPWLLFEAGGLTKGLGKSHVCTLLVDVEYQQLQPPLSLFNGTKPNKPDMKQLVRTINKGLGESRLDERKLDRAFEHWWNDFSLGFGKILSEFENDKAEELAQNPETVSALYKRIGELERQLEVKVLEEAAEILVVEGTVKAGEISRAEMAAEPPGEKKSKRRKGSAPKESARDFVQRSLFDP